MGRSKGRIEENNCFFFKAHVFIQRIMDLAAYDEGADDEGLCDDKLKDREGLAEHGVAGRALTRPGGLVLQRQDRFEAGQYQGRVAAGQEADGDDEGSQE